jgi:hypothetical protein
MRRSGMNRKAVHRIVQAAPVLSLCPSVPWPPRPAIRLHWALLDTFRISEYCYLP